MRGFPLTICWGLFILHRTHKNTGCQVTTLHFDLRPFWCYRKKAQRSNHEQQSKSFSQGNSYRRRNLDTLIKSFFVWKWKSCHFTDFKARTYLKWKIWKFYIWSKRIFKTSPTLCSQKLSVLSTSLWHCIIFSGEHIAFLQSHYICLAT